MKRSMVQRRHRKGRENKDEKKIGSKIPPKSRLGSFVKQTVGRVI